MEDPDLPTGPIYPQSVMDKRISIWNTDEVQPIGDLILGLWPLHVMTICKNAYSAEGYTRKCSLKCRLHTQVIINKFTSSPICNLCIQALINDYVHSSFNQQSTARMIQTLSFSKSHVYSSAYRQPASMMFGTQVSINNHVNASLNQQSVCAVQCHVTSSVNQRSTGTLKC